MIDKAICLIFFNAFLSISIAQTKDTVLVNQDSVLVEQVEVTTVKHKKVSNYWFVTAAYSNVIHVDRYWCESNHELYDGLVKTNRNELSHALDISVGYKFKNWLLSFVAQGASNHLVFRHVNESQVVSKSKQLDLMAKLGTRIKLGSHAVVPSLGLMVSTYSNKTIEMPIIDSTTHQMQSVVVNNFFKNGAMKVHLGLDMILFRKRKINPFFGIRFTKAFTRETTLSTGLLLHRFSFLPSVGLVLKL